MSELTRCNYCTLRAMRRHAEGRGVTVVLGKDEQGWTTATYSDRNKPSAHFMKLTEGCVC